MPNHAYMREKCDLNENASIVTEENELENVFHKMASILSGLIVLKV